MNAALVFDGYDLHIPLSMGDPLPDQCQGTKLEVLGELASRICYDSLGLDEVGKRRGRSSVALHEHILQVRNHSVYEHGNFTVRFKVGDDYLPLISFLNRKGVWLEFGDVPGLEGSYENGFEATVNSRVVLEWERHTKGANKNPYTEEVGRILGWHAHQLAPRIFPDVPACSHLLEKTELKTKGLTDDQAWISLWLYGSRGFTHEQVRHRFAMSQRSTRYVDETSSPWIEHPLITQFLSDGVQSGSQQMGFRTRIDHAIDSARDAYEFGCDVLTQFCMEKGLDKTSARKQARGASRGFLGNALASEMIYSAPVSGWKWILSQRKNKLADAEIREVYSPGLTALQQSVYGDRFAEYKTIPSPDGLGTVLV